MFFEEFLRKTDQKRNINKFLIKNYPIKQERVKILSIGAGSGEDVLGFLDHLKSKNIDFEFFYLDTSKKSFDLFKKKVKKLSSLSSISCAEFNKFESARINEKFDMIVASHVFYYIGKWEKSLNKLYSLLKSGGKAFIFMQSKDSDNFRFRSKFLNNEKCGEDLLKVIEKLGFKYTSKTITSTLDMTDTLLKNNKIPLEGKRLLSFLMRTDYDQINKDTREEISEYLVKNARIKGKRRVFRLVDNYITVHK